MAGVEREERTLGWAERLAVGVACLVPLGLTVVLITVLVESEDPVYDWLGDRDAPEWLLSLSGLGLAMGPYVVGVGGVVATAWLGSWVGELLTRPHRAPGATVEDPEPARPDEAVDGDGRPWPLGLAGAVGTLLLFWGGLGLVSLPWEIADHARAERLFLEGRWVEATDVRVEVDTPWYVEPLFAEPEVRHVEVRIPGVSGGDWVNLTGLLPPALDDSVVIGWQDGSSAVWYEPPLAVYYLVEGDEVHAMADADIADRMDSGVGVEPVLPVAGLLLVLGSRGPDLLVRWRTWRGRQRAGPHRPRHANDTRTADEPGPQRADG